MSEMSEFSVSAVSRKRAESEGPATRAMAVPAAGIAAGPAAATAVPPAGNALMLPFDPLRLLSALLRNWKWVLLSGVCLGALGGGFAWMRFKTDVTAMAQLMRQETAGTFRASESGEPFKPRLLSIPTLVSLMKSPTVLQRAGEQMKPQMSAPAVLAGLTIAPERNTDLIRVSFKTTQNPSAAVRLLNLYCAEVVRLTRDMQAQEAAEVNRFLKQQLAKADADLQQVNKDLLAFSKEANLVNVDKETDAFLRKLGELDLRYETARIDYETFDLKIRALESELVGHSPLGERLMVAREQLAELRQRYTEKNPLIEEQLGRVAELEKLAKEAEHKPPAPPRQGESGLAASFYQELVTQRSQKEVLAVQLEKLKTVREGLGERLRELPEKGMQYARIRARQQSLEAAQALLTGRQREAQLYEENAPGYCRFFEAKPDDIEYASPKKKQLMLAVAGGLMGAFFCAALVCLVESFDDRLKTAADLKRATKLPLLATLPDLAGIDQATQTRWAFRTWTALQARLVPGPGRSIVCGMLSESAGEGCSTWVNLLAAAASQRELKVVVVTNHLPPGVTATPLSEALLNPGTIKPQIEQPIWLVAPVDWQWTAPHRRQWLSALAQWTRVETLVALVELPPANHPESLLMAETLPQLIWLSASAKANGREIAARLETMQHANCRFAGAVLNRESRQWPLGGGNL